MANSDSAPSVPPPAPLSSKKENITPINLKIAELSESRQELLSRIQGLKQDLQGWRSKLDTQVKVYRDYDAVGWAPKEYNPDNKQPSGGQEPSGGEVAGPKDAYSLQSGFVWDEASGYYYDASSGFYYDGNTGLYYDGNNGVWYSYDHQTQQYVPYSD